VARGWTMVRDPIKILSQGCCGYKHFSDMRGGLRVLRSIAHCEAHLGRGVPVLQAYAQSILKATAGVKLSTAVELDNFEYNGLLAQGADGLKTEAEAISSETRLMFEKSWGVSPEEQVRWEAALSRGFRVPEGWSNVRPTPVEECLGPCPE